MITGIVAFFKLKAITKELEYHQNKVIELSKEIANIYGKINKELKPNKITVKDIYRIFCYFGEPCGTMITQCPNDKIIHKAYFDFAQNKNIKKALEDIKIIARYQKIQDEKRTNTKRTNTKESN